MAKDLLDDRQRKFLSYASSMLAELARERGVDPSDSEIEFPSASLDVDGQPRFVMTLSTSLVGGDLGAAQLFYQDVVGRGFEFPMRRFLDLHLRSDDVFIDMGAHWGIHSLSAATLRPGEISVIAIEANPDNAARLRLWVERNGLEADIEIVTKAVGDREGDTRMWVSSGSSMGHHLRAMANDGMTSINVGMTTLDRILAERPHLRCRRFILKIDVEGYEPEVLSGARHLFSAEEIAVVLWEKSAFYRPELPARCDATILEFLDSHGFEHFRMEDERGGGRLMRLDPNAFQGNVFSLAPGFERKEQYG